jgi:DNA (cytosine-5)-methyltransferase 1
MGKKQSVKLSTNNNLTVADLFCGAGGFSEGFRLAGFNIVYALDNWKYARLTHKLNHPDCIHPGLDVDISDGGDILNITPINVLDKIPDVDVIVGSPPCVDFSSSNKAGGADKTKGIQLVEKFLQIIAIKKHLPNSSLKYWLVENVPNSKKHVFTQYTFKHLGLSNLLLKKLGIPKKQDDVALEINADSSNIFNASDYGVPQNRVRFIFGEFPKPEKKTPSDTQKVTMCDVLTQLRKKEGYILDVLHDYSLHNSEISDHYYPTDLPKSDWEEAFVKKQYGRYYGRMSFPENEQKPSRTIMATRSFRSRESIILANGSPGTYRGLTIREAASLMSFPFYYQFEGNSEENKYRLVGNAVCPLLSKSIGLAILDDLKIKRVKPVHKKTSLPLLDLRKNNPSPRKTFVRNTYAVFVEVLPGSKTNNYRVELDNGLLLKNNRINWSMSIHHGTGKGNMKYAKPRIDTIKSMLINSISKQKFDAFDKELKNSFERKIPTSNDFQKYYCRNNVPKGIFSPRKAMFRISEIVEKHFPEKNIQIENKIKGTSRQRIVFSLPTPRDTIPLVVLAGAFAVAYVASLTKNKIGGLLNGKIA